MKKILLALFGILFFTSSCTSQNYIESGLLNTIVQQKQFTFMAERVDILSPDVVNVINSIPNSSYARMQDLDYGYDIVFENNEMIVYLPYFGRTYNPSRDLDKAGFKFTSKDFTIDEKEGKKGKKLLTIKPNDVNNVNAIYMEISPNGKCYVSINANDRQPISFTGYIMKNEVKKGDSKIKN